MFKDLDPLLNSELRLGIMSLLVGLTKADFSYLKEKTGATAGNLSVQLRKLEKAGYLRIRKSFKGSYPQTSCRITKGGKKAFYNHMSALQSYFDIAKNRPS